MSNFSVRQEHCAESAPQVKLGESVELLADGGVISGTVMWIEPNGQLVVRIEGQPVIWDGEDWVLDC